MSKSLVVEVVETGQTEDLQRNCVSAPGPSMGVVSRPYGGGRAAALFYSLIDSAKLCGVEPRAYLGQAARRAIRNPGNVTLARGVK